jgi:Chaperone of endosialidase
VNPKENFRDLDGQDVLAKIASMPIREWNYKAQDAAVRHVGPTAQDFHAAFGLGEDPLRISTIDADGIALAAIQALARENLELRQRIEALELLIRQR